MKMDTLEDLYIDQLKDLYNAENQLVAALPKMAKAVSSDELREAIENHLEETKGHVTRLEEIFKELGKSPKGKHCKAMEGLLEEGKEVLEADAEPAVKDAAIIAAAQRVEHYEMAGYGCVRAYAETLGYENAAALLDETLQEEGAADKGLTEIALSVINVEAAGDDVDVEEDDEDEDDEEAASTKKKTAAKK